MPDSVEEAKSGNDLAKKLACKRLIYASLYEIIAFCPQRNRLKKPFNPILGETYELVLDEFKCVAEQVSHHPPVSAYHIEGRNYAVEGYNHLD